MPTGHHLGVHLKSTFSFTSIARIAYILLQQLFALNGIYVLVNSLVTGSSAPIRREN